MISYKPLKNFLCVFLSVFHFEMNALSIGEVIKYPTTQKGTVFGYWGWNRSLYSKSNIQLKGDDYNLTLKRVSAHDRQSEISYYNYLKLDRITIPQTNIKVGYFIKNGLAISFNIDHMKYVMDQDQTVNVSGNISREGPYNNSYDNTPMKLTEDFLRFEHTDGLNFVNVALEKHQYIYATKKDWLRINFYAGGGIGVLVPKTNAQFLDYERSDRFHLAGFGLNGNVGLNFTFFKYFSIRWDNKIGYINMPDILMHQKGINGKAKQSFWFEETAGMLGFSFLIK